jgi:predicted adenylyl cyclase CyaB
MAGPGRNLELKAIDNDPEGSLRVCAELGADDKDVLHQVDTYFVVPRGRLKLRRERGAVAQLIAYERPDLPGQKESRYRIVAVEDAAGLEEALAVSLGISAVVRKARRLFLLDGVRIHLDQVEGLGSFIEFEGVADPGDADLARFEGRLRDLRRAFGIAGSDLVGGSYCDLILAAADDP